MLIIIFATAAVFFLFLSLFLFFCNHKIAGELRNERYLARLNRKKMYYKVKNDLQLLLGLFDLQSHTTKDSILQQIMAQVSGRVYAMVLVHQLVCLSNKEDFVDITEYIRQLAKMKTGTVEKGLASSVLVSTKSVYLPEKIAVTASLVINEILDNALRYGLLTSFAVILPVVVTVKMSGSLVSISFRDTGSGYIPIDQNQTNTMGATLIRTFTTQLGGSVRYNTGNAIQSPELDLFEDGALPPLPQNSGTEVVLTFLVPDHTKQG